MGVLCSGVPRFAYFMASCFMVEQDKKPNSMPPRTLVVSFLCMSSLGIARLPMPRYTGSAFVSLPSFSTAEFITCSVVVYRLPSVRKAI